MISAIILRVLTLPFSLHILFRKLNAANSSKANIMAID